jgi:membrane protease YdiL (CAAX protease family)
MEFHFNITITDLFYYLLLIIPILIPFFHRAIDNEWRAYTFLIILMIIELFNPDAGIYVFRISIAIFLLYEFIMCKDTMLLKVEKDRFSFSWLHILYALVITSFAYYVKIYLMKAYYIPPPIESRPDIPYQKSIVVLVTETSFIKVALVGINIMFISPILEEFAYRFVIYDYVLKKKLKFNTNVAMLITTFLFAFAHTGPPAIYSSFIMGLFFNIIYEKWGIWPAIASHSLANAIVFFIIRIF